MRDVPGGSDWSDDLRDVPGGNRDPLKDESRDRRSREPNVRSVRRGARSTRPSSTRVRSVLLGAAGIASLLGAGAAVSSHVAGLAAFGSGHNLLPVVDLSSRASQVWSCPGPLPVGRGSTRSAIDVVDPGPTAAEALVSVVELPATGPHRPIVTSSKAPTASNVTIAAGSQRVIDLPAEGAAGLAAVSLVSSGAPVAVSEVISGLATPVSSPCDLGMSVTSYLASGSTSGGSDSRLSISDPTATPAVVDVRVFEAGRAASPPALQGLAVPADGAIVVDIGHFVVQQAVTAASVTATTGRVAPGAFEEVSQARVGSGNSLATAVGSPRDLWVLPPGPTGQGRSVLLRLFNPGSRGTTVLITSPFPGEPTAEISVRVGAGSAADVPLPVPVPVRKRGGRPRASGQLVASSSVSSLQQPEGPIIVRSTGAVGIVVSAQTTIPVKGESSLVAFSAAAAEASTGWLLPGAVSTRATSDVVEVANPGQRIARVTLSQLGGAAGALPLAGFEVPPGRCLAVLLAKNVVDVPAFALQLSSSQPVVTEQVFVSTGGRSGAAGIPTSG